MDVPSPPEAERYLAHERQFRLGQLVTEQSHPLTRDLSAVARRDVLAAMRLLNSVDEEVPPALERAAGALDRVIETVVRALLDGRRVFFTGCGATGRLSIQMEAWWRGFWQAFPDPSLRERYEDSVLSVMAGGDYALISSVEGFEDFASFGRKQLKDLGVASGDVVIAVTEGGETSHVIGTAHAGIDTGAHVFFVCNNPGDVLCATIERSRAIITDPAVIAINLTTGPQAITGSTRMQAATIDTLALGYVLEAVLYRLLRDALPADALADLGFTGSHADIRALVREAHAIPGIVARALPDLARIATLEAQTYRDGGNFHAPDDPHPERGYSLYVAGASSGTAVLADTTERSPTFSTPPFRRQDRPGEKASPVYVAIDAPDNMAAWRAILRRDPRGLDWDAATYEALGERFGRMPTITDHDIMQFVIDGPSVLGFRPIGVGNLVIGVCLGDEARLLDGSFLSGTLSLNRERGGKTALIVVAERQPVVLPVTDAAVVLTVPRSPLRVAQAIALKLLLNTLSTTVMTLLGRVSGNSMTYVAPTNKKLVDRATRLITALAGVPYDDANRYLFSVLNDTAEDRAIGRGLPPPVNIAIVRAKTGLPTAEAIAALRRHDGSLDALVESRDARPGAKSGRYGI